MTKHPAVRFPSALDFPLEVKERLKTVAKHFATLSGTSAPLCIVGSYSRGCADFHSDLDLCLNTSEDLRLPEQACSYLMTSMSDYGLRIQLTIEDLEQTPKRWYDILADEWHRLDDPEASKRWDWNPGTKEWFERPPKVLVRPVKITIGVIDDAGDFHDGVDPWAALVPQYETMPGFLKIGATTDTAHYG